MTNKQPVPKRGEAGLQRRREVAEPGTVAHRAGLLRVSASRRPFGLRPVRDDRPALPGSAPDRDHDPVGESMRSTSATRSSSRRRSREGKSTHEIPFGAIERPDAIEFPAQNWVDHGDGRRGLALLNIGLPGNLVTDGTMMISLLRAHTLGAYGFGGGYEPGMSSETGFQLGQERVVRYAMVPHSGDWRKAGVFRDGLEFNHPLICRKVLPHAGPLPNRWGLLEISDPNVVVSSLKPLATARRR